MATSESDDFESADEELMHGGVSSAKTNVRNSRWSKPTVVDSESDDDTECIPYQPRKNFQTVTTYDRSDRKKGRDTSKDTAADAVSSSNLRDDRKSGENIGVASSKNITDNEEVSTSKLSNKMADSNSSEAKRNRHKKLPDACKKLGARRISTKVMSENTSDLDAMKEIEEEVILDNTTSLKEEFLQADTQSAIMDTAFKSETKKEKGVTSGEFSNETISEADMPEELKSNKKFKEIFKPQGWEKIGNDVELPDDLTEQKIQPVLDRLSLGSQDSESINAWNNWTNWGVTSLLSTATAGVNTLTNHVSQGLTLLEEAIGVPEPEEVAASDEQEKSTDEKTPEEAPQLQSLGSFGFGSLLSGVSSITKLVETTGTKVMTGGLDTLEAIGKKTMEVLQEGDPGLKKKKAFFMNETQKPNLSQVLREAKEKAESEEKTIEEKQLARKIHFETLFDDYQGLVHLEALEMLSKQCNMKIQGRLVALDTDELTSMQETLEEIKELCDLGDDDDDDNDDNDDENDDSNGNEEQVEGNKKDFKSRIANASKDLGISVTYEKLHDVWDETKKYLTPPLSHTDQEVFQYAISTIAKFTALCVERFHKTAELLLIKERRSTVTEADVLVQITRLLTNEISSLATIFCNALNEFTKDSNKADSINNNITTVFLEASNASSYVQDAFRLLIPILQAGAL